MQDSGKIQYLERKDIDTVKWDRCIETAPNGLIYAYSYYLDHMAKQWDAYVLGDYEAVMPLTWNKKFGIKYLYQPFLSAQLGFFGKNSVQAAPRFITELSQQKQFRLVEINLNHGNLVAVQGNKHVEDRDNYILDLSKPYSELYAGFRENTQRNIKKAMSLGCTIEKDLDVEKLIELSVAQMKTYGSESKENVNRFRKLFHFLHRKQMAITYGVVTASGALLSSCAFFFSHNRAYYILVGNSPESKSTGASHALIDAFIKDHAGNNMLLDFEGSDIPNLAFFYSSFGAVNQAYPALKINRLPFYLKWLKR